MVIDYQRVWAQIDLDAVAANMRQVRDIVPRLSSVMAIVKADAYGHGAVEASKVLLYNGADSLGVAICNEGIQLRENNIHVPVLILGYTPTPRLSDVVSYHLAQTVFHMDMARDLSVAAQKLNETATVHIKIDTGMSRLGFLPTMDTVDEIVHIMKLPNIYVEGIYTHFAASDTPDIIFTYEQFDRFTFVLDLLKKRGVNIPVVHAANSGAILNFREFPCNMVRAGIILYGLAPSPQCDLMGISLAPAMSLKTRVSYVKRLPANVSVGYGRTYYTSENSRIATIPVGYADGYSRSLGNKGRVLINGKFAPVIGNICMDQFMVDVTHIEDVREDDEVTLIGPLGGNEITADEIARLEDTINYEVVCNIGKRVPRLYIKNNRMIRTINYV